MVLTSHLFDIQTSFIETVIELHPPPNNNAPFVPVPLIVFRVQEQAYHPRELVRLLTVEVCRRLSLESGDAYGLPAAGSPVGWAPGFSIVGAYPVCARTVVRLHRSLGGQVSLRTAARSSLVTRAPRGTW